MARLSNKFHTIIDDYIIDKGSGTQRDSIRFHVVYIIKSISLLLYVVTIRFYFKFDKTL